MIGSDCARYSLAHKQLAVANITPVEIPIPHDAKGILIRFQDLTISWKFSTSSAGASDGMPMSAGNALSIDGPMKAQSIWVYQDSGGSVDVHWTYLYPNVR